MHLFKNFCYVPESGDKKTKRHKLPVKGVLGLVGDRGWSGSVIHLPKMEAQCSALTYR